jgi:hypothetical protein
MKKLLDNLIPVAIRKFYTLERQSLDHNKKVLAQYHFDDLIFESFANYNGDREKSLILWLTKWREMYLDVFRKSVIQK